MCGETEIRHYGVFSYIKETPDSTSKRHLQHFIHFFKGLEVAVDDRGLTLRALLFSMDLHANAHFLEMNHHNGAQSRKDCLIVGKHVASGRDTANIYPFKEAVTAQKRTKHSFRQDGHNALTHGKTVGSRGSMLEVLTSTCQ